MKNKKFIPLALLVGLTLQIVNSDSVRGQADVDRVGSGPIINMDDTTTAEDPDYRFFLGSDSFDFDIRTGTGDSCAWTVKNDTLGNTLTLSEAGVGIGRQDPLASLHVFADGFPFQNATIRTEATNDLPAADRTMIEVVNNGPSIMNFLDTSTSPAGNYQLRTSTDRFSVQQFGGRRAGLIVFEDGAVRFVADGQPNFTVTPEGSLNVVGSGEGGGNLNVGLGSSIGPDDGNLFVRRNIRYEGELLGPSDRNLKENFEKIDPKVILQKVSDLPITQWNYKADRRDTLHLGPMAQDFAEAFGLGNDNKRISMMDSDGIALAAIKGLSQIVDEKDSQISELKKLAKQQKKQVTQLTDRLERLEELVAQQAASSALHVNASQ